MCGIFAFLTKSPGIKLGLTASRINKMEEILNAAFMCGKNRGPEASKYILSLDQKIQQQYDNHTTDEIISDDTIVNNEKPENRYWDPESVYWFAGFHRLAINGLTENGMQPFVKNGVVLICNGEIYNYKSLYRDIGVTHKSQYGSDCQVILDYYLKYGIDYTVSKLHGVYAFVLIDTRLCNKGGKMFIVRDRLGIRSLYWGNPDAKSSSWNPSNIGRTYAVASELKQLTALSGDSNPFYNNSTIPEQFPAGHIATIDMLNGTHTLKRYWSPEEHISYSNDVMHYDKSNYKTRLVEALFNAVKQRVDACEREICCLLSGGLDSSLIASMVSRIIRERGQRVKTFSIGMAGSEDLKYARIVADFIDSEHTEVIVTNDDMFNTIPDVVRAIETYDTTTVRASVGNYLVCKYIKENCNAKVVFNGDGADEVMGGYLYFQAITDYNTHELERLRLLNEINHYDVLRSDKCIAGNGLEARTPYLDPDFIRVYFNAAAQYHNETGKMTRVEKELFRLSLDEYANNGTRSHYKYLPEEVLYRRKEAFSDGVSGEEKSWKDVIEDKMRENNIQWELFVGGFVNNEETMTYEQTWYKKLFNDAILSPYYMTFNDLEKGFYKRLETRWMPRFVNASDPSARTLELYNKQT